MPFSCKYFFESLFKIFTECPINNWIKNTIHVCEHSAYNACSVWVFTLMSVTKIWPQPKYLIWQPTSGKNNDHRNEHFCCSDILISGEDIVPLPNGFTACFSIITSYVQTTTDDVAIGSSSFNLKAYFSWVARVFALVASGVVKSVGTSIQVK